MKQPKTLDSAIVARFVKRLSNEYTAHHSYQHLSNVLTGLGFEKAGEFFRKESDDELVHARKIQKFLVDWNVNFKLPIAPVNVPEIKTLADAVDFAYDLEYSLYVDYEDDAAAAIKEGEIGAANILMEMVQIQVTSVAEYSDKKNILQGCDLKDKFQMLQIEKKLF